MQSIPSNKLTTVNASSKEARENSACYALLNKELIGRSGKKWRAIQRTDIKTGRAGGSFSVGYVVADENGKTAFMKVSDAGLLSQSSDLARALLEATHQHLFEVRILDVCHGNNMDKIVRALDSGEDNIVHNGIREFIFFIIFELADCDSRSVIDKSKGYDFLWTLQALHNLAIAVKQLHTQNIAHNDIKPANVLIFQKLTHKLSDLGRAIQNGVSGPFDTAALPGDWLYAAPEQMYKKRNNLNGRTPFELRKASDLYLLGSMGYFFITGVQLTAAMNTIIGDALMPINWTGPYEEVLPYLQNAFGSAIAQLDECLPRSSSKEKQISAELSLAIKQLCDPNPLKRGYPQMSASSEGIYSVERYISLFNKLTHQYQIGL